MRDGHWTASLRVGALVTAALVATVLVPVALGTSGGAQATAIACWQFEGDFADSVGVFDGVAPATAGNDAQVTAANPSPAGGQSLLLDGDGDYITVGKPIPATGPYSKTMWAFRAGPNADAQWENLYTSGDPGGPHGILVDPNNGSNLHVYHRNADTGTGAEHADTGRTMATGEWVHLAVVYDNDADTLATYYQGALVDTYIAVGTLGEMIDDDNIGAYAAMQSYWNGQIDDVCVHGSALSAAEVAALAAVGASTCAGQAVTVDLGAGDVPTAMADVILGTAGDDVIAAGDGDDVICVGAGNDTVWGQDGNDEIYGEAGDDLLRGGDGDDMLFGGEGNDDLKGGRDNDDVFGEAGDDIAVRGGTGDDLLDGGDGAETLINGNGGEDVVSGGEGNDVKVNGGPRPDVVSGGSGNDLVKGNGGADDLFGDAGDDEILGGPQPDTIDGGAGTDICNGGTTGDDAVESDTTANCETESNIP